MAGRRNTEDDILRAVHPHGECLLWTGCLTDRGYGRVWFGGRQRRAHVVTWEIHHGPVPPGLEVCHSCDVPACCRVDHLWLGTRLDNAADMRSKGRSLKGRPIPAERRERITASHRARAQKLRGI